MLNSDVAGMVQGSTEIVKLYCGDKAQIILDVADTIDKVVDLVDKFLEHGGLSEIVLLGADGKYYAVTTIISVAEVDKEAYADLIK